MREISFRAKRISDGEWVEGYYAIARDRRGLEQHNILITDNKHGYFEWHEINPETLCQFTGLHDKHGNKIWENDIVRCYKYISGYDFVWNEKVQYKNGHFRSKSVANLGFCSKRQNILVIGNIFDNPELLKGE